MKYVLTFLAIISLSGLAGCQPSANGNVVTSDMGNGGSGGSY